MIRLQKGVTLLTGNYGSGKTEVAVNLCRLLALRGERVTLADLDVVNPYFRCREAARELEELGVRVIIPREGYFFADLPIILPEIRGAMTSGQGAFIGDVGGDDVGARVLSSFADAFREGEYELLLVLNANRPFTDTPDGASRALDEIEAASRLRVGGLVVNTHLLEETDSDTVDKGIALAEEVSRRHDVPLRIVCVPRGMEKSMNKGPHREILLPIDRTMLPPWKSRETPIGPMNFTL
jgi:hypothetical protein